jgi:hypothetical protein
MKTSELNKQNPGANLTLILSALLFIGFSFACRAAEANGYAPILQPSIFWHNNQWETYENGQWVPYRGSANNTAVEPEPEETVIMEEPPPPDMVDTNIYYPTYGWGFIGAPALYPQHRFLHTKRRVRTEHRKPETSIGQPNAGLGKQTIGIGRPNAGLGQSTIGIGKPNAGIGQPSVGIGQPNTALGQPTIGIGKPNTGIGQPNAGIGHTTIGIGQPNAGAGQPNVGVGQPNAGVGRTTIGIGQPITGQQPR